MADITPAALLGIRANAAGITLINPVELPAAAAGSVKVAILLVTTDPHRPTQTTLERENPLVNIIKQLCQTWGLDDPDSYQLHFDDTKVTPPPIYITEENRDMMKSGDFLKLDFSPQKMSKILVDGLQNDNISADNIRRLAVLSADITFVDHFITENGFVSLTKFIINVAKRGRLSPRSGPALAAFVDIMDHLIMSWEILDEEFLNSVIWHLDEKHDRDHLAIKSSLIILERAIRNSSVGKNLAVQSKLGVVNFTSTLKTRDEDIQVRCISLINTILSVSPKDKKHQIRKQLLSQPIRQVVWDSIITAPIRPAMAYQLYCLQTRLINLLSDRLHWAIDIKDPAANKEVNELRSIAFDDDDGDTSIIVQEPGKASHSKDFAKLGFRNATEPLLEFQEAPPGALALDCMAFFARQYTGQYRQVVLENSRERADEQDCPFARASVELTRLLADILKIGVPPCEPEGEDERTYYNMFFFKEKPFEECFCVCIQRLTKTWKEMKASLSDFPKVLMVVKEQITRALKENPHTFDSLKTKLNAWNFAKIQEARQKELERKEEEKRQAKPIQELREMIRPEIEELIKQQRINRMIDGCHFKAGKAGKAGKEKFLYCKLSHNTKVLHYGNSANEHAIPESSESLNILDIDDVREGDEKETKTKSKAIIISRQGGEELILYSDTSSDHDVWLDGLHALTDNKPIVSRQAEIELDELLSMELKLRLLDAESINFPDEPPPIPDPPSNFNFVTV